MIRPSKLRGLSRRLPLKVRKKKGKKSGWKTALQDYGYGRSNTPRGRGRGLLLLASLRERGAGVLQFLGPGRQRRPGEGGDKLPLGRLLGRGAAVLLVLALAGLLVMPAYRYLAAIELFRVKDIRISGCTRTDPGELKKMAGLDYTSSMISISKEDVTEYIVRHPWVKAVTVEKVWPDTIRLDIREHRAAALLVKDGPGAGKMIYIDRQGLQIAPVNTGDELDYPVITGWYGIAEEHREAALQDAVSFLKYTAYNNPNLPAQSVSEIHFDPVEGMVVRLVDFPFPIYFGTGGVKKKYRQLRSVLAVLYKKRKNDIDISDVEYIRMEYLTDKVLVAERNSE